MLEPDVPIHPVDRVRARQGQGEEEGARDRLVRRLLLLERLPLQPSAGGWVGGWVTLPTSFGRAYLPSPPCIIFSLFFLQPLAVRLLSNIKHGGQTARYVCRGKIAACLARASRFSFAGHFQAPRTFNDEVGVSRPPVWCVVFCVVLLFVTEARPSPHGYLSVRSSPHGVACRLPLTHMCILFVRVAIP